MRFWKILLLASFLLLILSGGLYFFAPELKEDVLSKGIRKVSYRQLKTMEGSEEKIREKIKSDSAKKVRANKNLSKDKIAFEIRANLDLARDNLELECSNASQLIDNFGDLIDGESEIYQNPEKVQDVLNEGLGRTFMAIRDFEAQTRPTVEEMLSLREGEISSDEFKKIWGRYETMIKNCEMNNTLGPLTLTLTEVVSEVNPKYSPFIVRISTNLAMAYFEHRSFDALFLGAGLLRNMNSRGLLSKAETYDLEVLSERLQITYDNYLFERKKGKTLQEAQDVIRYFDEETLVLGELLKEFSNKIQVTYSGH